MKKMRRIILVAVVFFLIPTFANAATTYQDFQMQMPKSVQSQLSQGYDWKMIEVSETGQNHVLLLYGKPSNNVAQDELTANYLLLQIPKDNWQETISHMWLLPDYQDDYGIVTKMNIVDNTIWLHFWEGNGQYLICNIDEQGAVVTRHFLNNAIMLSENGVVAYIADNKTIMFWDGINETVYPIGETSHEIRAVAELNRKVYYLDATGDLYQITNHKPLLVGSVQDLYATLNENSYENNCSKKLDYLNSVNCFYMEYALWIMVNDNNLHGEKYLLKYNGKNFAEYEASAVGTIKSCWKSVDGKIYFVATDYFPTIPHGFFNAENLTAYRLEKDEATKIQYKEEIRRYKSSNGMLWEYPQRSDLWMFSVEKNDKKTVLCNFRC